MNRVALAALLAAASACSSRGTTADASRAAPIPAADPAPPDAAAAAAPSFDDLEPAAASDRADAGTVTIKLVADARRQARVLWGRKDLGVAPLEIVRPRGSGPLDLIVQAPGYLPLHTRVFTDRDDTLSLRLYTDGEAAGLPGYSPATATPTAPAAIKTPATGKAPTVPRPPSAAKKQGQF
jgi:nucleoid-associated protein YgaU